MHSMGFRNLIVEQERKRVHTTARKFCSSPEWKRNVRNSLASTSEDDDDDLKFIIIMCICRMIYLVQIEALMLNGKVCRVAERCTPRRVQSSLAQQKRNIIAIVCFERYDACTQTLPPAHLQCDSHNTIQRQEYIMTNNIHVLAS